MTYRRFIAWTIPACVIWTFAYVSIGAVAAGSYHKLEGRLHYAGFVFVGIIAAFLLVAYLVRTLLHHREARHMESDDHSPRDP